MEFIKKYTEFLFEKKKESFEDKIEGDGYYKGISISTARQKVDQMKKQSQMSDDDPDAYKEMPGDTKGKKLLKKSKFSKIKIFFKKIEKITKLNEINPILIKSLS